MVNPQETPLVWLGSSKKDLMALPLNVRKFFGHALDYAQRGTYHESAKALKGFGGAGVLEIVEDNRDSTFRAVYTVKFKEAVSYYTYSRKRASTALRRLNRIST